MKKFPPYPLLLEPTRLLMEIRMKKISMTIVESCVTLGEFHFSTYIKIEHYAIHRVSNVKKFEEMKAGTIYYFIKALSTILLACFDALICKISNGKVEKIWNKGLWWYLIDIFLTYPVGILNIREEFFKKSDRNSFKIMSEKANVPSKFLAWCSRSWIVFQSCTRGSGRSINLRGKIVIWRA